MHGLFQSYQSAHNSEIKTKYNSWDFFVCPLLRVLYGRFHLTHPLSRLESKSSPSNSTSSTSTFSAIAGTPVNSTHMVDGVLIMPDYKLLFPESTTAK